MSIIIPGCKCFFIVARSISVILYCLIPVIPGSNVIWKEGKFSYLRQPQIIQTNYSRVWLVTLCCLYPDTCYTTSLNICCREHPRMCLCFYLARPAHLTGAKYARGEQHPRFSLVCASVKLVSLTRQVPRVLPPPWREELGNEVVTCAQSSACYVVQFVPALVIFLKGGYDYTFFLFGKHISLLSLAFKRRFY